MESGSATAEVWANGYGYWGSLYFEVPEGGSNTLYMHWGDYLKDGTRKLMISTTKPPDWKPKNKN